MIATSARTRARRARDFFVSVPKVGFWQAQQKKIAKTHTSDPIIIIIFLGPKIAKIAKWTPYTSPGGVVAIKGLN